MSAPISDHPDLERIASAVDACMLSDRRNIRQRLKRLRSLVRTGRPHDRALKKLDELVSASVAIAGKRSESLPRISYPDDLPVSARREEIARAIKDNQVVVVCGETGSGKTTQLPKICLELGRGVFGTIGHTQPRRVAARSVARRIGAELGVPKNTLIGSKVRFTDETSEQTLVKVMTDGVLLAETQGDRQLLAYDTIILDEAHERSLNIDFLLGYLRGLLPSRPDLRVLVTSATIDTERFSEHFGGAPIIEVSGRTFPIETRYEPVAGDDDDEPDIEGAVVSAVREAIDGGEGDVLVFLTGEREIRDTADSLRAALGERAQVLPMYARLGIEEQERVFAPHEGRRVVLATNIAETSITVPGIRWVIDPGFARISRYAGRSRVQRLPIERISRASANQRAGRCGRVGPGVCIRLYSKEEYEAQPEFTDPEAVRTDLAGLILRMKSLRLGDVERFPFLDPPDRRQIRAGIDTLRELGALDDDGELTAIGADLATLPVEPRIGRMLYEGQERDCLRDVLILAGALSAQDPRVRPLDAQKAADEAHAAFRDQSSDFVTLLNIWHAYHEQRREGSRKALQRWCRERFLSYPRIREWVETHRQLDALVRERGWRSNAEATSYGRLHQALLTGLLSYVGKKSEGHEYEGPGGNRFSIFPGSTVFSKQPQWVMAAEMVRTTRLYARTVAQVEARWIERAAGDLLKRNYADAHWRRKEGRVFAYETAALQGMQVIRRRPVHFGPIDPVVSRELFIHHALVDGDTDLEAECLAHNHALEHEVELLEAKTREPDLLRTANDRFEFYNARVPKHVYTAMAFDEWRRHIEKSNPTALYMDRSDVLSEAALQLDPSQDPDVIEADGGRLRVEYALAPGEDIDGVTVTAPLQMMHEIDPDQILWQSPNLLRRRIIERIRLLPKDIRTSFVPAPNFVRRALGQIRARTGSPDEAVALALEAIAGVRIPREIWRSQQLPDHLLINYRIIDEDGQMIAQGRDLDVLRRALSEDAASALSTIEHPQFNRGNLRDWDFGDLPESVRIERNDGAITGFPALIEVDGRTDLRLLPSRSAAERAHPMGLRRLFMRHCAEEMRHQRERILSRDDLVLLLSAFGDARSLADDILARAAERTFIGDSPPVRTREGFDRMLDVGWNLLSPTVDEVIRLVQHIFHQRREIEAALADAPDAWSEAAEDIRAQVGRLTPEGFVRTVAYRWLNQYPRYLEAVKIRIGRLRGGGADAVTWDSERAAQARRCDRAYAGAIGAGNLDEQREQNLEEFRWMTEEFRVWLFAERLGTIEPVSPERMEAHWAELGG